MKAVQTNCYELSPYGIIGRLEIMVETIKLSKIEQG